MNLQRLLWSILIAFIVAIAGVYAFQQFAAIGKQRAAKLRIYGRMPDFTLTERNGRSVSLADLKGHIWVCDFIFTSCAGTCPIMTQNMRHLQDELPPDSDVFLVSFSVDPQNDTPSVLREYAKSYGASKDRWLFLTGKKEVIHGLAHKLKLAVRDGADPDEPIIHSQRFVLIDRQGRVRGYYDGTDKKAVRRLLRDIQALH